MAHIRTVFLLFLSSLASLEAQDSKQIIFIAGPDSHGRGEHEHNGGCTILANSIHANVSDASATVFHNQWPADTTVLDKAAAIVTYADRGEEQMNSHTRGIWIGS